MLGVSFRSGLGKNKKKKFGKETRPKMKGKWKMDRNWNF
jgi:hypothetical protein